MDCPKLLIYGYYHKNNFGDNWFAKTFTELFPDFNLTFTVDALDLLKKWDYIIVGGGNIIHKALGDILSQIQTPYEIWSVSLHDPCELEYIKNARKIIVRDSTSFSYSKNSNIYYLPDINFYPNSFIKFVETNNSIAFIPNSHIIPTYNDSISKNQEYFRFVFECSKFIDENNNRFSFLPLQNSREQNDIRVAHAIISHSVKKPEHILDVPVFNNIPIFNGYISMRYHGAFLGILTEKPVLYIDFHSKVKNIVKDLNLESICYYEFSRKTIADGLEKAFNVDLKTRQEIKNNILKKIIKYNEFAQELTQEVFSKI